MRRAEVLALAARVEALTGPDRTVDQDVARAVGWVERRGHWDMPGGSRPWGYSWLDIPRYTASLDAAASLVPAGWACEALSWWPDGLCKARLWGTHEFRGGRWHGSRDPHADAEAATPALALTAAALRAIAEGMSDEG